MESTLSMSHFFFFLPMILGSQSFTILYIETNSLQLEIIFSEEENVFEKLSEIALLTKFE